MLEHIYCQVQDLIEEAEMILDEYETLTPVEKAVNGWARIKKVIAITRARNDLVKALEKNDKDAYHLEKSRLEGNIISYDEAYL